MQNIQEDKKIYRKPVDTIVSKIDSSDNQSILLAGDISTGKSIVLNELLKKDSDKNYIDITVKNDEYIMHLDDDVFHLSQVCLIVKKMINYIKEKNSKEYFHFINLERLISFYYTQINYMYITDNYKNKYDKIDRYILEHPEMLIEEFMSIVSLDAKTIRLVIDNFDSIGHSSKRYQTYIYNLLKQYLKLIITISDRTVLNNEDRIRNLKENNEIIEVNYSHNVEDVKKIIETSFASDMRRFGNDKVITSIGFILSDEEIELMIEKTNGNLFNILCAVRHLYSNIDTLRREEYGVFVLNYIDKEINKNPLISGRVTRERILHIK